MMTQKTAAGFTQFSTRHLIANSRHHAKAQDTHLPKTKATFCPTPAWWFDCQRVSQPKSDGFNPLSSNP